MLFQHIYCSMMQWNWMPTKSGYPISLWKVWYPLSTRQPGMKEVYLLIFVSKHLTKNKCNQNGKNIFLSFTLKVIWLYRQFQTCCLIRWYSYIYLFRGIPMALRRGQTLGITWIITPLEYVKTEAPTAFSNGISLQQMQQPFSFILTYNKRVWLL